MNKKSNNNYFVHESSYIDENCIIGEDTKVWHFSHIQSNVKIGSNCHYNPYTFIDLIYPKLITIGDNVIMGQYVSFHSQNHSIDIKKNFKEQNVTSKGIKIGSNVWKLCYFLKNRVKNG